ncbi:unnamed protein product [Pedinophyceae sp. YPF-701]|nr:unnamed protein product [Pedinophyceae sp. YPF-701]
MMEWQRALLPLLALLACLSNLAAASGVERTFALIKPHAVPLAGSIWNYARQREGLKVIALRNVLVTEEQATKLYQQHFSAPFYLDLKKMIKSAPCQVAVLEGPDAVERWRRLLGPTDPSKAYQGDPDSIRAIYGLDVTNNAAHGSDSADAAVREMRIFFTDEEINAHGEMGHKHSAHVFHGHDVLDWEAVQRDWLDAATQQERQRLQTITRIRATRRLRGDEDAAKAELMNEGPEVQEMRERAMREAARFAQRRKRVEAEAAATYDTVPKAEARAAGGDVGGVGDEGGDSDEEEAPESFDGHAGEGEPLSKEEL